MDFYNQTFILKLKPDGVKKKIMTFLHRKQNDLEIRERTKIPNTFTCSITRETTFIRHSTILYTKNLILYLFCICKRLSNGK